MNVVLKLWNALKALFEMMRDRRTEEEWEREQW